MEVRLNALSKRFARDWVFKDLSFLIPKSAHLAVTGPNGAGKSTLLKIISGAMPATQGSVGYKVGEEEVRVDEVFRRLSFAAPYLELIEEFNLEEAWRFHGKFRKWAGEMAAFPAFKAALEYPFGPETRIGAMSSGMKQRIRLAFAFFTEADLVILDEPTSNLDDKGIDWFHRVVSEHLANRTTVIASNVPEDLRSCTLTLELAPTPSLL